MSGSSEFAPSIHHVSSTSCPAGARALMDDRNQMRCGNKDCIAKDKAPRAMWYARAAVLQENGEPIIERGKPLMRGAYRCNACATDFAIEHNVTLSISGGA